MLTGSCDRYRRNSWKRSQSRKKVATQQKTLRPAKAKTYKINLLPNFK